MKNIPSSLGTIKNEYPKTGVSSTLPGFHYLQAIGEEVSVWFLFDVKPPKKKPRFLEL